MRLIDRLFGKKKAEQAMAQRQQAERSFEDRLTTKVKAAVESIVKEALYDAESALSKIKDVFGLTYEIKKLKEELEQTKITKLRTDEEHAKKIREVEHKVGLERKRQEMENDQAKQAIELAKREAVVSVREENLKAERAAFDERIKYYEKQADARLADLKDIIKPLVQALPKAELLVTRGEETK